jgi:SLT domain-containing protein
MLKALLTIMAGVDNMIAMIRWIRRKLGSNFINYGALGN